MARAMMSASLAAAGWANVNDVQKSSQEQKSSKYNNAFNDSCLDFPLLSHFLNQMIDTFLMEDKKRQSLLIILLHMTFSAWALNHRAKAKHMYYTIKY